jgi:hypothetical protein
VSDRFVDVCRVSAGLAVAILLAASAPAVLAQNAASPPATQSAAAARPPAPNRVNEHLPTWLRVRGEYRVRVEGFEGASFVAGRDDLYALGRVRLNATIAPARALSFQIQAQDARVGGKHIGPTGAPFKAPIDLRMAFADLGAAQSRATLRIGRQELVFGEQRLVGHVSWLNAARTFDGLRITLRGATGTLDGFATSVVRTLDGEFDKSGNGNRFAGVHFSTAAVVARAAFEPYLFWRADRNLPTETGTRGDLRQVTFGVRLAGAMAGGWDYSTETAGQAGSLGTDEVRAWAGHYQVRTPPIARGLRAVAEYNVASGDADPADGRRGTFDQLYPTPHDKYGLADQVGWRNVHHARAGMELTRFSVLPIIANYHSWWLVEPRDGLYTAGGAPLARIAAGAPSRHVGQELDIQTTRMLTPQIQLAAGYAHIFTGGFLEAATPGASYSHPYVMVTYVFLAEK